MKMIKYLKSLGLTDIDSDSRPDGTDTIFWGYNEDKYYEISAGDLQYHAKTFHFLF